jgi:hypothetical protein
MTNIFICLPFCFLCLTSHAQITHGTTVAYVANHDTVWLGVDSKVTNAASGKVSATTRCKIICDMGFYAAPIDLYSYRDKYDVFATIREVIDNSDLSDRARILYKIKDSVHQRLKRLLPEIRRTDRRYFDTTKLLSELVLFTFQGGKLRWLDVGIRKKINKNGKLQIYDTISSTDAILNDGRPYNVAVGGQQDSAAIVNKIITKYGADAIANDPKFKIKGDRSNHFVSFSEIVFYDIYVETIAAKDDVSEPIEVAVITKDGLKWRYDQLKCPCDH